MKAKLVVTAVVIMLLVLTAFVVFAPGDEKMIVAKDVRYGEHERNVMDIYIPDTDDNSTLPVFMYIHGGGWTSGDKEDGVGWKDITEAIGCILVTINYRYISFDDGGTDCEDILQDIDAAIQYLKDHADEYGIDTEGMAIGGDSAGAHLSLLYSYSRDSPIEIKVVMSRVGPTDLTDNNFYAGFNADREGGESTPEGAAYLISMLSGTTCTFNRSTDTIEFSDVGKVEWISPAYHIEQMTLQKIPRTILAYGGLDTLVPTSQPDILIEKFESIGFTDFKYILFPNSWHDLADDNDVQNELLNEFLMAMHEELGTKLIQV